MDEKVGKVISVMWLINFTILKTVCQALSQITHNDTLLFKLHI